MKKKLLIVLGVLVIGAGGAYETVLKPKPPKPKIDGTVYVLGKDFLVNLSGGKFAKLSVALALPPTALPKSGGEGGAPAVEGYGALPEEAAVRDIVTDQLTGLPASDLVDRAARDRLKQQLLRRIRRSTDVEATDLLITDVTVQ